MGQSLFFPPYGSNYAYWKVKKRVFLNFMNMRVWVSVQKHRTTPTIFVAGVIAPTV